MERRRRRARRPVCQDPRSKDVKMTSRENEGAPVSLVFMYNRTQGSTEQKYVVANYVWNTYAI